MWPLSGAVAPNRSSMEYYPMALAGSAISFKSFASGTLIHLTESATLTNSFRKARRVGRKKEACCLYQL